MASCHPTSLRSFSSDRSHPPGHASYLRDSAVTDDAVLIPSHQVRHSAFMFLLGELVNMA